MELFFVDIPYIVLYYKNLSTEDPAAGDEEIGVYPSSFLVDLR